MNISKPNGKGHMCKELAEANMKIQESYKPDIKPKDTISIYYSEKEKSWMLSIPTWQEEFSTFGSDSVPVKCCAYCGKRLGSNNITSNTINKLQKLMATSSKDWSSSELDAILYGIVLGWSDSDVEEYEGVKKDLKEKYNWSDKDWEDIHKIKI